MALVRHMDRFSFAVLWLVPLVMTAHNLEEALFMRAALPEVNVLVAASPVGFLAPVSHPQFLIALGVVTVIPYLFVALGALRCGTRLAARLLVLVQTTMLINVVFHVGAALALRGYAPGLLTALFLNLPFSIWLLHRAMRDKWVTPDVLRYFGLLALILHGPALVALIYGAGTIG